MSQGEKKVLLTLGLLVISFPAGTFDDLVSPRILNLPLGLLLLLLLLDDVSFMVANIAPLNSFSSVGVRCLFLRGFGEGDRECALVVDESNSRRGPD